MLTLDYLNNSASGYSKAEDLVKIKLARVDFFVDTNYSKSDVELLFALRTRSVSDSKVNFPSQYINNLVFDLQGASQYFSQLRFLQFLGFRGT